MSNGMRLCAQGARGMGRFSPNSFRNIASRISSLLERVLLQDLTVKSRSTSTTARIGYVGVRPLAREYIDKHLKGLLKWCLTRMALT